MPGESKGMLIVYISLRMYFLKEGWFDKLLLGSSSVGGCLFPKLHQLIPSRFQDLGRLVPLICVCSDFSTIPLPALTEHIFDRIILKNIRWQADGQNLD